MKGQKTKYLGILQTLRNGPDCYGPNQHERECAEEAEKILLEAKEPLAYRKELLEALLDYNRKEARDSEAMSNEDF